MRRIIKRNQGDSDGLPWEIYNDLLYVGDAEDLGLLAKAAPWVIYKRNATKRLVAVFGGIWDADTGVCL